MADIIAAYIAHGGRRQDCSKTRSDYSVNADLSRQWKRLYCLFALHHRLHGDADRPDYVVISDHPAPSVDGVLIGHHLHRLGVEIDVLEHNWRPDHHVPAGSFFLFDAMEYLADRTKADDALLVFSGRSLAVSRLEEIFSEISKNRAVIVEEGIGEIPEDHVRAMRDRMIDLRHALAIPFPRDAILSANPDCIGLRADLLKTLIGHLRKQFPFMLLRAMRGEDHFLSAGELLGALLAIEDHHHSTLHKVTHYAAAMPEDFAVSRMADVPVIIPGYGREPDIDALFSLLIPDRISQIDDIASETIFQMMKAGAEPGASKFFETVIRPIRFWARV